MMPYVVQFNMAAAADRYSDIVKAVGDYDGQTSIEGALKFVEYIRDLQKVLSMPTTIKQMGVDEADFKSKLEMLAKNAIADGSTPPNPRTPSVDDIKNIYMCAYNGIDVI
jgi:alcohol dehydrogenase class IV